MTNPDEGIQLAPGTDITVDPAQVEALSAQEADTPTSTEGEPEGGTGGGNAGGAG